MARHINTYRALQIDEDEETNKINIERKATKKLREIDSLKKKDKNDLTDSEKDKMDKEKYWKDILIPIPKEEYKECTKEEDKVLKRENERQKKEEEKKRQKKDNKKYEEQQKKYREEKQKRQEDAFKKQQEQQTKWREEKQKRQEEKLKKKEEERKKQEEEWKKQEEKKKWWEEELKRQEKEDQRKRQEKEENERRFYPIEAEYKKRLKECNGNTDKAFRKCSFKYHPDKNPGNEVVATENQKKLLEIHERYSN